MTVRGKNKASSGNDIRAYIGRFVQFLNWKLKYLSDHKMLNADILASDLNTLCELIDESSTDDDTNGDNFAINESLAYILHAFMPAVTSTPSLL